MTIIKKLCVVTGEYQKGGETKKRWKTIGYVHEYDGREYITIDATFSPAGVPRKPGSDQIAASMFEADDKREKPSDDFLSDDVKF